jgi:hypothetical protein
MAEFSRIFGVPVDALLGQPVRAGAKRGPAPKLQQHMQRISRLPRAQQRVVMQMLSTECSRRRAAKGRKSR